ncbi:MAG: PorP/SprF family type IX secretion system membrane protein [Prevotellaceae bacterium]|nr:PorP/SprF family type IX secretion system membrane protein [Prevotellaceae bacterium]
MKVQALVYKFGVLLISVTLLAHTLKAQSDYDLTQRWMNESMYNPAAVGNSFTTGVFLHGRVQWLGLDGAPLTQTVTFDTYADNISSAFGVVFSRDEIGYLTSYTAKLSYAYYIPLTTKSTVSLGLSAGLFNRNRKLEEGMSEQSNDPVLAYKRVSNYAPEFDFGIEYKGPFKLGASVRHLGIYGDSKLPSPSLNIWTYLSSRFNITQTISIEPCVSYMYRNKIGRGEGGSLFYFMKTENRNTYNDRFWLGGMYRFHGQFAILAGVNITSKMRLGYSFDYGTGDLSTISRSGTHEIFLSWQFNRIFYKEETCPAYKSYERRRK